MSFTLLELETTVINLPYAAAGTFGTPDSPVVHRACRYAVNRWLRDTKCSRTSADVTITDGSTTVNIVTTAADFEPACLTGPISITAANELISIVDYTAILSRRNTGGSATGKPRLLAFVSATEAQFFPEADANYTIKVPYWRPKATFTPGATGSGVTIHIPDTYIGDIALGALAYLNIEFPDRQSKQCMDLFERALRKARGELAATGIHLTERYRGFDSSYMNDAFN